MRASTALLAGLAAHSMAASPPPCIQERVLDPTDRCHSPQKTGLWECLSGILRDITQNGLQNCFEKAGCEVLDAKFEAEWVFESCSRDVELRKRQGSKREDNNSDGETTTTKDSEPTATKQDEEETTTKEEKTTTEEATTTEEPTTEATTEDVATEVATTTVESEVTAADANTDTATDTDTTSPKTSTTTGSLATVTSPTECFTTITYTTSGWDIITTNTAGRVSRTYNSEKVAAKTRCADGLVCRDDGCMVADNSLRGSGIAVAIFFASAAAVSFATLVLLCCRDRRNDKKLRAKMEAAKIAKETAKPAVVAAAGARSVSAGRRSPSGADRAPLMHQGGMYPPSPQSGRPSHDPFGDQRRI